MENGGCAFGELSVCVWSGVYDMETRRRGGGQESTADYTRCLRGDFLHLILL